VRQELMLLTDLLSGHREVSMLHGSCLCGGGKYEINGRLSGFERVIYGFTRDRLEPGARPEPVPSKRG
jgi:hypothetical protein